MIKDIHWNTEKNGTFIKGNAPHNKGKTKENYEPLKIVSKKLKKARKQKGKNWYFKNFDWTNKNKKISKALAGKPKSQEHIQKIISNPNYIESRKELGKRNGTKKQRNAVKKSALKHFADEEWKEKWFEKFLEAKTIRPSKFEKEIIQEIKKLKLPLKYVGDGSVWIGKKNPDFINVNGAKQLLEIASKTEKDFRYGSWEKYRRERETHFAKFGYKTCFLWQEDKDYTHYLTNIVKAERR